MKKLVVILLSVLSLHVLWANPIYYDGQERYFVGHRGNMDQFPENTLEGMWQSLNDGLNALEIDLQVTKDRKLVLWHDFFAFRPALYNAKCFLLVPANHTLAELQRDCITKGNGSAVTVSSFDDVVSSGILEDSRLEFLFLDIKVPPSKFYKRNIVSEVAIATENALKEIDSEIFLRKIGLNIRNYKLIEKLREDSVLLETPNYIHYGATGVEPLTNYDRWKAKLDRYGLKWVSINLTLGLALKPLLKKRNEPLNIIKKAHHDGFKVNCWTLVSKKKVGEALKLGCDSVLANKPKYFPL